MLRRSLASSSSRRPSGKWLPANRRSDPGTSLICSSVTIPDPLDSRLPHLFDRSLATIQRAAELDGYVLDRFDLPWIEEIRQKVPSKKTKLSNQTHLRRMPRNLTVMMQTGSGTPNQVQGALL